MFHQDPRWNDGKKALYIHHLVASTAVPGAGKALLLFAQQLAVRQSIPLQRLDSQAGNKRLEVTMMLSAFVWWEHAQRGHIRENCVKNGLTS